MEILFVWEILANISGRDKMTPLGVYIDQKSLIFLGLRKKVGCMHRFYSILFINAEVLEKFVYSLP